MRTVSATEASRSFAAILDAAEQGETIVVTRGGRRVATIGPASTSNGNALIDILGQGLPDTLLARDVEAARGVVTDDGPQWPDD